MFSYLTRFSHTYVACRIILIPQSFRVYIKSPCQPRTPKFVGVELIIQLLWEKDHYTSLLFNNTVALGINIFLTVIIIIIIICFYYRHKMKRFKICDPHSCMVHEFTYKKYSRPCPSHEGIKEEKKKISTLS